MEGEKKNRQLLFSALPGEISRRVGVKRATPPASTWIQTALIHQQENKFTQLLFPQFTFTLS